MSLTAAGALSPADVVYTAVVAILYIKPTKTTFITAIESYEAVVSSFGLFDNFY